MGGTDDTSAFGAALAAAGQALSRGIGQVTSFPDHLMSIASLTCALVIAAAWLATRRGRSLHRALVFARGRPARPRLLPLRALRLILPAGYLRHRSHRLDLLLYIANTHVVGLAIGWLLLSGKQITIATHAALTALMGPVEPTQWPAWAVWAVCSVALFLAYEFGYWVDHYLGHKVPALWEFHKVHHQAEVLSPLTVFRVHPIDSLVFSNILAVSIGTVNGCLHYLFCLPSADVGLFNFDLILVGFAYILLQLQHSQIWIPFSGRLGCILVSPAHHQIHHSTNPLHFDKNLGSCLAVFDWMFGTLHLPAAHREKLSFGVEPETADAAEPHTLSEGVIAPFARSARHLTSAVADQIRVLEALSRPRAHD